MLRLLFQWIDRCAINAGARAVGDKIHPNTNREASRILADPDFFALENNLTPLVNQLTAHDFSFASPSPLGFKNNDLAHGRFWKAGSAGKRAVLLVHGWNAEGQYQHSFPRMARKLNQLGLSAAALELPWHCHRRPDEPDAPSNFISSDLRVMILAVKQALHDLHTTALWMRQQGCDEIFVLGFSLGSWLAGLLACFSGAITGAVLVTPVSRMDLAIRELAFCKPIKDALALDPFAFEKVNLTSHQPLIPPANILLVQSVYDLFAGEAHVGELCRKWNQPELWKVRHGHISILFSNRQMRRISRWITERDLSPPPVPSPVPV